MGGQVKLGEKNGMKIILLWVWEVMHIRYEEIAYAFEVWFILCMKRISSCARKIHSVYDEYFVMCMTNVAL